MPTTPDMRVHTPAPETQIVDTYRIACDGGEGALGHPRVWLQVPEATGMVECPYCDKQIIHRDHEQEFLRKGGADAET